MVRSYRPFSDESVDITPNPYNNYTYLSVGVEVTLIHKMKSPIPYACMKYNLIGRQSITQNLMYSHIYNML